MAIGEMSKRREEVGAALGVGLAPPNLTKENHSQYLPDASKSLPEPLKVSWPEI